MSKGKTRLQKILYGADIDAKTRLDAAVKYAVQNSGGGGGGSSALICDGSVETDSETGDMVYTLETPLADIVEAYQNGRSVLLPFSAGADGLTRFLTVQAVLVTADLTIVTFYASFHADGVAENTIVAFHGSQTANVIAETSYDGPFVIPGTIDMTAQPPTFASDVAYSKILHEYQEGRDLQILADVDVGVQELAIKTVVSLSVIRKDTPSSNEVFFFGTVIDFGNDVSYCEIEIGENSKELKKISLTASGT